MVCTLSIGRGPDPSGITATTCDVCGRRRDELPRGKRYFFSGVERRPFVDCRIHAYYALIDVRKCTECNDERRALRDALVH